MSNISKMTGTPWHIENAKGDGINNSKNCAFNCNRCTCKISPNHGNECVGKLECDEFERGSKAQQKSKNKKKSLTPHKTPKENKCDNKTVKKRYKKLFIEYGDKVIVHDEQDNKIEIDIKDINNPFYGKMLYEVIRIKGEKYSIRGIIKSKRK